MAQTIHTEEAMNEISAVPAIQQQTRRTCRRLPAEDRARVGRVAVQLGNKFAAAEFNLPESTVRGIKRKYIEAMDASGVGETTLTSLPESKRGRKCLLPDGMDDEVQEYIRGQRARGSVITRCNVIAIGKAVVAKNRKNSLLVEYGGTIDLTKHWAASILNRMKFVKRRGSTKVRVPVQEFEHLKDIYLRDIKATVVMEEIPSSLIINWDQTAISIVPRSTWTMAPQGSRRVKIAGMGDKRQIMAVFAGTLDGQFLPQQLIYTGKTAACYPKVQIPSRWHITNTSNHWANETTMKDYLLKIIVPYVSTTRENNNLPPNHPALVIFDVFKGQMCQSTIDILSANNIHYVHVPPNCTDRLQPLDLSVNKPCKDFIKNKFIAWYSSQVLQLMESEEAPALSCVPLRLPVLKPLGAKWLMEFQEYVTAHPEIIQNGFKAAGIADVLDYTF